MTQAPLAWVKEIHNTLIDAKVIPLSGFIPSFPWDSFAKKTAELLQVPECNIVLRHTEILEGAEITAGLGVGFISLALELTPLKGQAFWMMGKEEVAKLTSLALVSSSGNPGFSSPQFQEGFYHYLATKMLLALDALQALSDLCLKLGKPSSLPLEEALCFDVEIQLSKHTFWGRLVCPASLHEAFKTHFDTKPPAPLSSALAKQLDVTVALTIGHTTLALSQWQKVGIGDCILLDSCSFDPKTHKGTATLMLQDTPLLRVRIKENSLKIVDYAIYHQEHNAMDTDLPQDEDNIEDTLSSTEFQEEIDSEENPLWASQNESTQQMISSKDIPLMLSVEVARLNINLEKLLQLEPGNVLELPVRPEQGVDLVIGGKKVAKAELIKLGEMLGIKILQIGKQEF